MGTASGAEKPSGAADMVPEVAWEGPGLRGKTIGTVLRLCVKTVPSGPTNPMKNAGPSTKSAFIVGGLDTS